ncbi:hypothetical protein EC973_004318 [Apophysomyces ossiformis]|uniref:Amino acid transporter transmembrane domain-containing protein n=1 Tax=Apophysomyces ossiformis TaxID=679940 RepID=A0A8H7BG34_9FUNG|nr:hypothetical protein EC973_004318 [Apophysomyces ossiformis]
MASYGSIPKKEYLTKAERDLLQSDRPGYGSRSIPEAAFNMVNATVGAGIIGLPFAIAHAGFFAGIVLSIFVAAQSQLGLYLLILAGQRVGIYKFAHLMEYIMGRTGFHLLNFIVFFQAGGACVSYFILLGDSVPVLCGRYLPQFPLLAQREYVIPLIGTFFILPLTFSRSIGALARWSFIGVLCIPVILLTLAIRAPAYAPDTGFPLDWVGPDVLGALGIMAFAFTCSHVAFNNYLTLHDQSSRAWGLTTILATLTSWAGSMAFGVVGYLAFGDKVQPNLFLNFADDDPVVNVGRLALACSMILSIPTAFFPTREAAQKSLGFETTTTQPTQWQHYSVTVILFYMILGVGITIRDLGSVYRVAGSVSANALAFILPGLCYLVTRFRPQPTVYPTLTATTTVAPDECDKPHIFSDGASIASSSRAILLDDEDISTVGEGDIHDLFDLPEPAWWLDVVAAGEILWGLSIMIFCTSSSAS